MLDLYDGWILYRKALDANPNLKGNQISTWNGQWISHRYDNNSYVQRIPMANFDPFSTKDNMMSVDVQSWTKVLIGISKTYPNSQMIGYVYNFGQMNTTIGFIPFMLNQIRKPVELYQKLFGFENSKIAETLWGTAYGLSKSCQAGSIGLKAMEPKGLKDYIIHGKTPKYSDDEKFKINNNVYLTWIMAMLDNEQLWAEAQEFAKELHNYASNSERGKKVNTNKVNMLLEATNKNNFIKGLTEIVADSENKIKIENIASIVNAMTADNIPYFLTLVRFHFAAINNTK